MTCFRKVLRAMIAPSVVGLCLTAAAPDLFAKGRRLSRPTGHFVRAGEIRLHYLAWGRQGSPILLIHGLYDDARVWSSVAPLLAKKHRVFALDRRGTRLTDKPDKGYDHKTLAGDVAAFIEKLKLDSVTLVGHSFGGETVLTAAASNHQKLRAIVLVEGGFFPKLEISSQGTMPVPPCEAPESVCLRNAALEKAVREYDAESLYPLVTRNTLLVMAVPSSNQGTDPELLKEFQQHVTTVARQKLLSGKISIIHNSSHWIQTDQPVELAKAIKEFIGEVNHE